MTTRPDDGTTARPNTGTSSRPSTGTSSRSDSGDSIKPRGDWDGAAYGSDYGPSSTPRP